MWDLTDRVAVFYAAPATPSTALLPLAFPSAAVATVATAPVSFPILRHVQLYSIRALPPVPCRTLERFVREIIISQGVLMRHQAAQQLTVPEVVRRRAFPRRRLLLLFGQEMILQMAAAFRVGLVAFDTFIVVSYVYRGSVNTLRWSVHFGGPMAVI